MKYNENEFWRQGGKGETKTSMALTSALFVHGKGFALKITRAEKVWLGLAVAFYVLYNIPFMPSYGDALGCILHGVATVLPLWIVVYVGFFKINRRYRLKGAAKGEGFDRQGGE